MLLDGLEEYLVEDPGSQEAAYLAALLLDTAVHFSHRVGPGRGCGLIVALQTQEEGGDSGNALQLALLQRYFPAQCWLQPDAAGPLNYSIFSMPQASIKYVNFSLDSVPSTPECSSKVTTYSNRAGRVPASTHLDWTAVRRAHFSSSAPALTRKVLPMKAPARAQPRRPPTPSTHPRGLTRGLRSPGCQPPTSASAGSRWSPGCTLLHSLPGEGGVESPEVHPTPGGSSLV